jgi:glycosyltransferase involved in cell wall biosynthesis
MDVIYLGRYNTTEILTGPEKVAKRIFENYSAKNKSLFVEYFFDGTKHGIFKKLFGKERVHSVNHSDIYRMGLIPIFFSLLKIKPKIIHIITFERFAIISFFCKLFFNVKIIYLMHGLIIHENKYFIKNNFFYNFKDKIAEEIFVKYSDLLLIFSAKFKNLLKSYYNINGRKIKFVTNGADNRFKNIEKINNGEEKKILKIVFIGDIDRKEKGFDFLKESLEMLNKEVELYIVDKKKKNERIKFKNKLIKTYCLDIMATDDYVEFLKGKDIYISSSVYDTFPIACIECISAGIISVISKETGQSELIKDGINGFVFDWGDKKKLIEIIKELVENKPLRDRISKESRKISDELSWEKITEEYSNIYNSILLTG